MADKKLNKNLELVPVKLPLIPDAKADQTVYVLFNEKSYRIMRGKTVMIPRGAKKILDESIEAQYKAVLYASEKALRESE